MTDKTTPSEAKKPFPVKLTANERGLLEAYRQKYGLRSESDAVRQMIARSVEGEVGA